MRAFKRPPRRNAIDLADNLQVRACTNRFRITQTKLEQVVRRIGPSIAIGKEIAMQRAASLPKHPDVPPPTIIAALVDLTEQLEMTTGDTAAR